MSTEFAGGSARGEEDDDPRVPVEVLDAIDDLAEGNTASNEDLDDALKF